MRRICSNFAQNNTDDDTTLQFIPFKSRSDKGWAEAWELYEKSFPYNERWNAEGYDRAFGDPNFEADGIWRGDEFIGILFHWGADGYRYVEHLAVSPALRGQNMGSAALSAFCRKVGRVILEIDPPVDDISIRRLRFYERLGFVANPYQYIHPSFRKPFTPHRLVLMSYPGAITYEEARSFADFVREAVLRYSEHERPHSAEFRRKKRIASSKTTVPTGIGRSAASISVPHVRVRTTTSS